MKKLLLTLALLLLPSLAWAQCNGVFPNNTACGNITGITNTPRPIPLTSFPANAPGGTTGQIQYNAGSGLFGGFTMSGDCTTNTTTGVITCPIPYIDLRKVAVSPETPATVCTGLDDTATINAAIAALPNGRGTIVAPPGTCLISSTITMLNSRGIRFTGQGSGGTTNAATIFNYTAASGAMFRLDGANGIEFDHINFTYSNASYTGDLFDLRMVSGSSDTAFVNIHDCGIYSVSGSSNDAASLVRLGISLNITISRCYLAGGVQLIKGGTSSNNILISFNWFDTGANTTSHIGICGEGWNIASNTFEGTNGTVANNIVANCAATATSINSNTFNDTASGTLIDISAFVLSGVSIDGNVLAGATVSVNAGAAIGLKVTSNFISSGAGCGVLVASAYNVIVLGNYGPTDPSAPGTVVCTLPTTGNNITDTNIPGTMVLSSLSTNPVNGTTGNPITASTYTVTSQDTALIFNGSGTITVTLGQFPGRFLFIKTIANQAVVSASSIVNPLAGGVNGTAILAATAGKWALLVHDFNNTWYIMASN